MASLGQNGTLGANMVALKFVRETFVAPLPPPASTHGPLAWARQNLVSGPFNIALTLLAIAFLVVTIPPLVRFLLVDSVWNGADRAACLQSEGGPPIGACWAFVRDRFSYFVYGSYPRSDVWRVNIVFLMGAIGLIWVLVPSLPRRDWGALYFFALYPLVAFVLLAGWPALGLRLVETNLWGGMLVTLVVAGVGIVVSLPLGIVLALGRRSNLPAVKFFSVLFIEFVRGVPLITVLFMASVMLPLFLPDGLQPDKLLRALVGVALFASAYMAEVVRAGLQALPKGQYEGAMAMGLSYWQMMRLVVLPQALKITLPNIVNTYIGLFKDTTLVFIVGLFDFLRAIDASLVDPAWATPVSRASGYAFAGLFYFVFCYGMSRYAHHLEVKLGRADRR